MNRFSKSVLLAGAAPLAIAAIISGGVAFAYQTGDSDTSGSSILTQQEPTPAPTTTTDDGATPDDSTTPSDEKCPNMGSGSGTGTHSAPGGTTDDAAAAGMTFRSRR